MPASRILEGSLPKQHPSAHIFLAPTTTRNEAKTGISRAKPWAKPLARLVRCGSGVASIQNTSL